MWTRSFLSAGHTALTRESDYSLFCFAPITMFFRWPTTRISSSKNFALFYLPIDLFPLCEWEPSWMVVAKLSTFGESFSAWVTRPGRPKGANHKVKQARRVQSRPEGPPSGCRGSEGLVVFKYGGCDILKSEGCQLIFIHWKPSSHSCCIMLSLWLCIFLREICIIFSKFVSTPTTSNMCRASAILLALPEHPWSVICYLHFFQQRALVCGLFGVPANSLGDKLKIACEEVFNWLEHLIEDHSSAQIFYWPNVSNELIWKWTIFQPVSLFLREAASMASSSNSRIAKTRPQSTSSKIAFARVFDSSPRTLM